MREQHALSLSLLPFSISIIVSKFSIAIKLLRNNKTNPSNNPTHSALRKQKVYPTSQQRQQQGT